MLTGVQKDSHWCSQSKIFFKTRDKVPRLKGQAHLMYLNMTLDAKLEYLIAIKAYRDIY
jgi:hypothetical protein